MCTQCKQQAPESFAPANHRCKPRPQLACARIGAVHSVVFGGFSAEALSGRILDSQPNVVITSSGTMRGPKPIGLKVCRLRVPLGHGHQLIGSLACLLCAASSN